MSMRHYGPTTAPWFEAYRAEMAAFRARVPDVESVKAAYVDGRIDVFELEEFVGAALEGRAVVWPPHRR